MSGDWVKSHDCSVRESCFVPSLFSSWVSQINYMYGEFYCLLKIPRWIKFACENQTWMTESTTVRVIDFQRVRFVKKWISFSFVRMGRIRPTLIFYNHQLIAMCESWGTHCDIKKCDEKIKLQIFLTADCQ